MKISIIGGGHIGGACAFGFLKSDIAEVMVTARTPKTLLKYENSGIISTLDNKKAASWADVVILAVKTAQMDEVLSDIGNEILKDKVVVSMAAQVSPDEISLYAPNLVYAIPNVAAQFGNSVTFISNISADSNQLAMVNEIYSTIGVTVEVKYDMLPAGISLASCGIGYAMEYMAAATRGAMQLGFSKEEAARIVCRTVMGACQVVEAGGYHPEDEVLKVATPGGLTERGLRKMNECGFSESVANGLKASL